MDPVKPEKKRFRPWPKRHDGGRWVVDKERIKALYIEGKVYEWGAFCQTHNFNPAKATKAVLRFGAWQAEWLNLWTKVDDDALIPQAVKVRREVLTARLRLPGKWGEQAEQLQQMLNFILRNEGLAIKHDLENETKIKAGEVQAKSKITAFEVARLAHAQKVIMELERAALLLPSDDTYEKVVPIRQQDATEVEEDKEDERLAAMGVQVPGVDPKDLAQLMAKFIDQAADQHPQIEDHSDADAIPAEGIPLDNLTDE